MEKQVVRFGPFKNFIANGVKIGNVLYLSGQVSVDNEGNVIGADDLVIQVRRCYANIKEVLDEYEAAMDSIVDEMWLVTDMKGTMSNIEQLFTVRAEAYGGNPDVTQTLVQVAGLVMPELLIEIKCIAHL
ncbi:MAG: Rid family hydrolase [Saprospiraceae bacterium]|nr:Rid family hydrolase [Saprospiraceae bacterium]